MSETAAIAKHRDKPRAERRPAEAAALKRRLIADARAEGFDAVGVTTPDAIPEAAGRLAQFLAEGQHGTMAWMAAKADRRGEPERTCGRRPAPSSCSASTTAPPAIRWRR